ncbi:MAG: hypothetical protein L6420_01490 [Elusimicrobia bacterium]|nr:hypothetical protein [Elusimicrobiota bacterium]
MKYLLFVNFSSGLKHNSEYNTLSEVCESIKQLIQDENFDIQKEKAPSVNSIKKHLESNDDYFNQLSNDTWYHIQPYPIFG